MSRGREPGILRIPGGGSSDGYFWNGNGVRNDNTVDKSRYNPKTYSWKIDYSAWKPGFFGFVGEGVFHLAGLFVNFFFADVEYVGEEVF